MHGWRSATNSKRARPSWMICALARGEADLMRACVGVVRACIGDYEYPSTVAADEGSRSALSAASPLFASGRDEALSRAWCESLVLVRRLRV
jgi:hypothetical protein